MANSIIHLLQVIAGNDWIGKIVGFSTNCAVYMTCSMSEDVIRLESALKSNVDHVSAESISTNLRFKRI